MKGLEIKKISDKAKQATYGIVFTSWNAVIVQDLLEEILEDKDIKKSASGKEEKKVVNDAKDKAEKLLKDVDGILTKMKKKWIDIKNI